MPPRVCTKYQGDYVFIDETYTFLERRITATQSIKISPVGSPTKHRSASPTVAPAATHVPQKSRLSRQVQLVVEENDPDMDADGDEDADAEEENEDETPYCFCQKQSYGDVSTSLSRYISTCAHDYLLYSQMIACDNEGGCPYEWVRTKKSFIEFIVLNLLFVFSVPFGLRRP